MWRVNAHIRRPHSSIDQILDGDKYCCVTHNGFICGRLHFQCCFCYLFWNFWKNNLGLILESIKFPFQFPSSRLTLDNSSSLFGIFQYTLCLEYFFVVFFMFCYQNSSESDDLFLNLCLLYKAHSLSFSFHLCFLKFTFKNQATLKSRLPKMPIDFTLRLKPFILHLIKRVGIPKHCVCIR